jgi:hypothetical protein
MALPSTVQNLSVVLRSKWRGERPLVFWKDAIVNAEGQEGVTPLRRWMRMKKQKEILLFARCRLVARYRGEQSVAVIGDDSRDRPMLH